MRKKNWVPHSQTHMCKIYSKCNKQQRKKYDNLCVVMYKNAHCSYEKVFQLKAKEYERTEKKMVYIMRPLETSAVCFSSCSELALKFGACTLYTHLQLDFDCTSVLCCDYLNVLNTLLHYIPQTNTHTSTYAQHNQASCFH